MVEICRVCKVIKGNLLFIAIDHLTHNPNKPLQDAEKQCIVQAMVIIHNMCQNPSKDMADLLRSLYLRMNDVMEYFNLWKWIEDGCLEDSDAQHEHHEPDSEIQQINRDYRNIDKPTNVLSFELGDDVLLGDIYISFDTVKKEAISENISFEDHCAHMVVHGVLHLMGYDHINDKDATVMEAKETKQDKTMQMKELENYAQELTQDVLDMIKDASADERQYLSRKIAGLANKITQISDNN